MWILNRYLLWLKGEKRMETPGLKKLFGFSTSETKQFIEKVIMNETENRKITQSIAIEEFLLKGIAVTYPELKENICDLYKRNLDSILLGEQDA